MLLAYARVWTYGWAYDDQAWLPVTQTALPWRQAGRFPFWLAESAGGGLPWAYHGLLVALHLVNGVLLWMLARRWMSAAAALGVVTLFWLHPIQREAVAYVSGGMEVMVAGYALAAVLALFAGWWVLGLLLVGLLATLKLSALPAVVVVVIAGCWTRARWVALVGATGLALLVAGTVFWSTPTLVSILTTAGDARALSLTTLALWRYLAYVVWPVGFSIEHDWYAVPAVLAACAPVAWVALGLMAWRVRPWWYAWLAVSALVLPRVLVPNAPPLTEHHTYLPWIPIWLAIGASLDAVKGRYGRTCCL